MSTSVAAYDSPARLVSRGGRSRGNAGTRNSPGSPVVVVNRTMLPSAPSVTTRIETCQATSSRSSSVSHSRLLQLKMSTEAAKREMGQSRSSMFRIAGAKKRHPRRGVLKTRAARWFGSEATTRRSHGRWATASSDSGVSAAWQPRKPIGSLSPNSPLLMSKVQSADRSGLANRLVGNA